MRCWCVPTPQTVVAQSPGTQTSNAPAYGVLQPGTRARPTVHTCRKAWACNHFSPLSSLSAAFTWASPNTQFACSQAGFVPGFPSAQRPGPDRSSSVCTTVSRHRSIQNCELICKELLRKEADPSPVDKLSGVHQAFPSLFSVLASTIHPQTRRVRTMHTRSSRV